MQPNKKQSSGTKPFFTALIHKFDSFTQQNILVLGDVMIDAYSFGKVERISPEAPVPVVHITSIENRLGGAANVALNLRALGASVQLFSVVGSDAAADALFELTKAQNIDTKGIIKITDRPTTQKQRIVSGSQQLLRIDHEVKTEISPYASELLLQKIEAALPQAQMLIFEDYDKGVLTPQLIQKAIALCKKHNVMCAADPKNNNFDKYVGVTLFKPNLKELYEGLKLSPKDLSAETLTTICEAFNQKLCAENMLVTLSEKGIFYYQKNGESGIVSAHKRNIADVSGAGDTVISVAAACLVAGMSLKTTAQVANVAGGLVCEQMGVVPINKALLLQEVLKTTEN